LPRIENRKLIIIVFVGLFLFFQILAIVLTKSLRRDLSQFEKAAGQVSKPQIPTDPSPKKSLLAPAEKKVRHHLIPADPRDYGFEVYSEETKPKVQEEWDILIRGALKTVELSLPEEKEKAMCSIEISREEYDKRMQDLDERMESFKEKLKKNPQDKEAANRLEKLQILKSLSKVLRKDLINK